MQDIVMYSTNLMKVLVSFRGDWIGGEVLGRYLGINLFFFFLFIFIHQFVHFYFCAVIIFFFLISLLLYASVLK